MSGDPDRHVAHLLGRITFGPRPAATSRACARTASPRTWKNVLVAVFQWGAVDGLGMIVPHGAPDYFDAQDYMESGTPGVRATPDGWLARSLAALPSGTSPFRAAAMTPTLPRALRGGPSAIALGSLDRSTCTPATPSVAASRRCTRRTQRTVPSTLPADSGTRCARSRS